MPVAFADFEVCALLLMVKNEGIISPILGTTEGNFTRLNVYHVNRELNKQPRQCIDFKEAHYHPLIAVACI